MATMIPVPDISLFIIGTRVELQLPFGKPVWKKVVELKKNPDGSGTIVLGDE